MTEEAKHPYYLRCLWGEKLQKYSEERWTQTGEPCWNDFKKEQIILPEGLPEKILKHLKSGYCAIIGPENTGKTWLCYGVGFELEKESDVWYVDKGDLKDIEVDVMLNFLEKYIRESEKSSCLIVEDCHRNEEATRRLLMRGRKIENLRVLFTTKKTDKSILKNVSEIKLPDDLLTSGEDYAKKIIEKILGIEGLSVYLDINDLENSAKIGCKDLSQLSECLNEWVERVRKGGFVKAVKLTDIIKEKEDKKRKEKLSDRAKDVIREIRLEPLDSRLISSASQEKINDFYSGGAPSPGTPSAWGVIAAGAVKRDLEDKIEQVLQENDNFHIICIVAEPGAGKTTLAMKVLYGLSQRGEQAFWLQGRSAEFWFKLSELTELINNRLYIFIDNIFRDIDFVEALHGINKGNLPVTIIATSRTNEYNDRNLKEFIKKMELKVSEKEKKELLVRIGKSYGNLSPDERKDFNETNLFLVLGMVLSKGKGFSEIIKDIVEKLKVKDEALYRAYEYVCFSSNYDLLIPEDLLRNLDKEGRFYGLLDEKSERCILAKGIFYEDFVPSYPMRFIKAGHQLIAKEALLYYSRDPKVLFEEIVDAADEENLVHRRYITDLIRAIFVEGQEISKKDVKDLITKSKKIDHILQYASISELNWWKLIYKQLNLQEEAEKCSDKILLQAPNTTQECQIIVSDFLNRKYLFNWENVPGKDNKSLLKFLKDCFDIKCTEKAKILKSDDGKIIRIVEDEKSVEIKFDVNAEKAFVKISDGRTSSLEIKKEKGKQNIYNSDFVKKAYSTIRTWLEEYPDDRTIFIRYISLLKDRGDKKQAEEAIEEVATWLRKHPEDKILRAIYLSLVKDKGDQDKIEKAVEATSKWLKDHQEDNIIREVYIVLIRDRGNKEQIKEAIEETVKWLKDHQEDNMICSDYLTLVRDKGFFEEYIKPALEDAEQRMKKHGPHPLFQDYIPLVDKIIKTEIDIDIDIELVKQFGYEIIDLWNQEFNTVYIRWIKNFADLLQLMGYPNEYEQIYEMLLKTEINPETKSAIRFSYGRKFLGEAMNPELTNDERIEKLRRAEVTFREILEIHRGHHMAYVFLYITLKEERRDNEAENELEHAKWWFPLNVKKKELFLFSSLPVSSKLVNKFNADVIPEEIKNDFVVRRNPLSRSATIKKIGYKRWQITDRSSAYPYYIVMIEKNKLNSYGNFHPGRIVYKIGKFYLDVYRYDEAKYWLEIATREEPKDFANWWRSGVAKMELASSIEEKGSHNEATDLCAEALSELETALEKAPKPLQLPASKDIPERIAKCRKQIFS